MTQYKNGGKGIVTFAVKEWMAIGIAVFSFVFSAGGWYFRAAQVDRRLDDLTMELSQNYVRKDVLGAQLADIQRQLVDQSMALQKMDLKLDAVNVAVAASKK